jgi:iron transport multicopper oxidase
MNDVVQPEFTVQPDTTYYLRIINIAGFAQFYLQIDGHDLTIIEVDGIYTDPQPVENIYIGNGQRYGVLIKTHPTSEQNYAILGAMDITAFDPDAIPPDIKPNVTGVLLYNGMDLIHKIIHFLCRIMRSLTKSKASKPPPTRVPCIQPSETFDDFNLVPNDKMPLHSGTPDYSIVLNLTFFDQIAPGNDQYR